MGAIVGCIIVADNEKHCMQQFKLRVLLVVAWYSLLPFDVAVDEHGKVYISDAQKEASLASSYLL